MTGHVGCDAVWQGVNTCHCIGCHVTFSGVVAFDQHRPASAGGKCLDPVVVGLELTDRKYPCFGRPKEREVDE